MDKKLKTLMAKAAEIKAKLDAVKPLYDEMDKLTMQIAELTQPGEYEIPDYEVTLVDNFAQKNVCFRPAAVRRFELKIEKKAS